MVDPAQIHSWMHLCGQRYLDSQHCAYLDAMWRDFLFLICTISMRLVTASIAVNALNLIFPPRNSIPMVLLGPWHIPQMELIGLPSLVIVHILCHLA